MTTAKSAAGLNTKHRVSKSFEATERQLAFSTMHQSIYDCKMRINNEIILKPIEYTLPVDADKEESNLICRIKAAFSVNDKSELNCRLSFDIVNIMNQKVNDVQYEIINKEMLNMNERQLGRYFESHIPLESFPLHRGVHSFRELPLIIHSFILPAFRAKLKFDDDKDSKLKKIIIDKQDNPKELLKKQLGIIGCQWCSARSAIVNIGYHITIAVCSE